MIVHQATTGRGGWPMSVFLTPDLQPVTGGTYFPPVDRWPQPGFHTILLRVCQQVMVFTYFTVGFSWNCVSRLRLVEEGGQ
jgi:hypothetical protein